jgi:nucleotide-binding universal stress UspA family protein
MDLDLMRRDIGQTMLAAGMIDDITGWTMLGLVTALAAAGTIGPAVVLTTVGYVVTFVVLTATVASWAVRRGTEIVQDRLESRDRMLTLVIVLAFAWGAVTQALHLEPVIGAFAVGILFGRVRRLPADVTHKLEGMTLGVFAPIFFAVAGLKVDVTTILEPDLLLITLAVIGVATVGKVVGVYAGARLLAKQDHWSALAYGSGLNARGAVEIIIATIGLSLGILSQQMFSMIVIMAVVTSVIAPVAIRFTLARVDMGDEEALRLRREEARAGAFVSQLRRVLVPVRPRSDLTGDAQVVGGALLRRLGETNELSITLFSSIDRRRRDDAERYLTSLRSLFDENAAVITRITTGDDAVGGILREAARDFDLLVLGAPEMSPSAGNLFGPMIDDLVKLSPCPTLVIRAPHVAGDWSPVRIVVPTTGSAASRNAAHLAFAIAGDDTVVTSVHVVTGDRVVGAYAEIGSDLERRVLAREMTSEIEAVGTSLSVATAGDVREAATAEEGILGAVTDLDADLLVIGTSVRAGTARLFLGHRVEYLVREAPCPVLILNT